MNRRGDGSLPAIVGRGLKAVFRGLDPGLAAAVSGHHFVGCGDRFQHVLHLAGFTPVLVETKNNTASWIPDWASQAWSRGRSRRSATIRDP